MRYWRGLIRLWNLARALDEEERAMNDDDAPNPVKTKLLERVAHHMMKAADAAQRRDDSAFFHHLKKARPIAVEIGRINGIERPEEGAPIKWIDSYLNPTTRETKDGAQHEKN